jgi:hypothetical protein
MGAEACLWRPSKERIAGSRLTDFQAFLNAQHRLSFDSYDELHQWSVDAPATFWQAVWDFSEVRASVAADAVLLDADRFPGARWFDGARLNYAENLLNRRTEGVAIIGRLENGERREISWPQLHAAVACAAAALRASGVGVGDRVAGMLPNVPETIIAMLATASIGALWSSCSPDFGVNGVLDRFGQIAPKILIACDGYYYNGKTIDCRGKIAEVASKLESLAATVVVPVLGGDLDVDKVHRLACLPRFSGGGGGSRAANPGLRTAALRSPALYHVLLGDHRRAQVHCAQRRRHAPAAYQGAPVACGPAARRRAVLLHHLRLDDVELGGHRIGQWRHAGAL